MYGLAHTGFSALIYGGLGLATVVGGSIATAVAKYRGRR